MTVYGVLFCIGQFLIEFQLVVRQVVNDILDRSGASGTLFLFKIIVVIITSVLKVLGIRTLPTGFSFTHGTSMLRGLLII
jgi:hypothetical protein